MKTFWSVKYSKLGADKPCIAWFDNKEGAFEFVKKDYTDKPIRHTYTNKQRIAEAEKLVSMTMYDFV